MAKDQAVWGIEIGQCALKAIRVGYVAETKRVQALAFDYIEHPKILSQPDADPDALSREALQTFLSRNSVKGDRVCIGVPGQSGLARFVKLPPIEPSRIAEIVKFEARQQIPFPLEEVVWDFQTIGEAEQIEGYMQETEIGLFAMKREFLQRFLAPFNESAVEVDAIQMRPLAVYNFASFDWMAMANGAKAEKPAEAEEGEAEASQEGAEAPAKPRGDADQFVVLLDIGSDNSDLVITNGTRIWQRNLPLGGNHFTRALTKDLKLTFAKAEHLKRNATKAQDPKAIFQAMRPVFNDFVSEIQRSVGYFSSVHRQSKITKILGMGNAFKLPGLQKFLAQNLQYEVEKVETFTRLDGESVMSAPVFQENLLGFAVAYGLALQGLGVSKVRTSLLPPEISRARMIRRKKPWALSSAAMLMTAFSCLFFGNWAQLNAVMHKDFKGAEDAANAAAKTQTDLKTQFDQAKTDWTTVKTTGETLTGNVDQRLQWLEVLAVITRALPKNPANANPKDPTSLSELEVTQVKATWYDDVKTTWFDKAMDPKNIWPSQTVHALDKADPPKGSGWVFRLEGHHFHKANVNHTRKAAFGGPEALQSAKVRQVGISGAMLTANNIKMNWDPRKQDSPGKTKSAGAKSRPTGGGSGGGRGMGSNMMGEGPAGAGGGGGAGKSAGATPQSRGAGSMGGEQNEGESTTQMQKGAGEGESLGQGDTGIGSRPLDRTDFTIEFAWVPVEKSKRKTLEEIEEAVKKAVSQAPAAAPPSTGAPPAAAGPQAPGRGPGGMGGAADPSN